MRAAVVSDITCFLGMPRIKSFHYNMFHGTTVVDLGERHGVPMNCQGRPRPALMRTGTRCPPIFSPGVVWIVSEQIRTLLQGLPHCDFTPAIFAKLFDMDFREGDLSWYDDPTRKQPPELFADLADVPAFHQRVGAYWWLEVFDNNKICSEFPDVASYSIDLGTITAWPSVDVFASRALLAEYPVTRARGSRVLRGDVYDMLAPHIHPDYYRVHFIDIP